MTKKRGCCAAQIGCCLGGVGCRFCCGCCPKVYESTTTRLMYTLMLLFGTICMCLALTPKIEEEILDKVPHFATACKVLYVGDRCELLVGYLAVYRTAFALSGFFLLMAFVTLCVTQSRGFRARLHNGAWLWKFLILIGIGVGVFAIPQERIGHFQMVWMYIALVGAVAFILIQLWLLVFFARSLGNKIDHRVAEGGSRFCWYSLSSLCTLACYAVTAVGIMSLFSFFTSWENCTTNKIFIGINAALCILLSVFSTLMCCGPRVLHSALLQSGIISVYITYLTWTALSSAPREPSPHPESIRAKSIAGPDSSSVLSDQKFYCGPDEISFKYNEYVLSWVGVVIMFFTVVYSSIGTSSDNAVALGINVRRPSRKLDDVPVEPVRSQSGCCSCMGGNPDRRRDNDKLDEEEAGGGQRVLANERYGTVYNYSLFHVVFCLASMYIMMTLTAWIRPEESNLTIFNQNWATVWIKMGSSWACVLLYLISLPMRRFGRYNRVDGPRNLARSDRDEVYERETVT